MKEETKKHIKKLNRIEGPDVVWTDRWTAVKIALGLIWISIWNPCVRIAIKKEQ